jgi:hypothetical protein
MRTTKFRALSAWAIAAACLLANVAGGATLPANSKVTTAATPAMKFKQKVKRVQIRPRIVGASAPQATAAKLATAKPAKSTAAAALVRSKITAKPSTALVKAGNMSIRPQISGFENVAQRVKGRVRTEVVADVRSLNSSSLGALQTAMPGFSDRAAKGASSLKDLGVTSDGSHRNPVTSAGSLSDFAGGGSGRYSEGGKKEDLGRGVVKETGADGTVYYHHADGTTVIVKPDGTTQAIGPEGDILTTNPDGSKEYDRNGETRTYDSNGTLYSTEKGNQIIFHQERGVSGSDNRPSRVIKQGGTKGEPIDDPHGSGGSGTPVVTAETLRGLIAKRTSAGTYTGDEATSGGAVDESKTRQGRIGQLGQPVDDGTAVRGAPTSLEITQAFRVRMRNVTPVPR